MPLQFHAPRLELMHQLLRARDGRLSRAALREGRVRVLHILAAHDAAHRPADQHLPSRSRGGRPWRQRSRQEHLSPPELFGHRLQLGPHARPLLHSRVLRSRKVWVAVRAGQPVEGPASCTTKHGPLFKPVRQQPPDELDSLGWVLQQAQPDNPREDQEELCITILAHLAEGRGHAAGPLDLRYQVAEGSEDVLVMHIAGAYLPTLLPSDEACDEAGILAKVGV
mmetsp:Transcript_66803/g.168687  ORF Transcript_66803/g.168687 Transcript_66803/m.168687 type:complete len:224 (+) Transcript_66803:244-915(+)